MGKKSDWLALGYWTVPDPTEKYGREWKGWKPVGKPPLIRGHPGDLELTPIADPSAKATLPRTRLDSSKWLLRNSSWRNSARWPQGFS